MIWVSGITVAILFGLVGGLGASAVGLVVGSLGWMWLSNSHKRRKKVSVVKKPKSSAPPPLPPSKEIGASPTPPVLPNFERLDRGSSTEVRDSRRQSPRKDAQIAWHTPEQPVSFEGVTLRCGLFYSADGATAWPGEPSAINTKLTVAKRMESPALDLGYYPSYENLTAAQRRTYLEWLVAGRRDSDPSSRSLGYLFLAFYGFERRLMLEGDRDPRLTAEIIQLLELYGSVHTSRSLRSYFLQLLHYSGWMLGSQSYRAQWPDLLQLDGDRPDEEGMKLVVANLYDLGEPMDWSVGYRVAMGDEISRRSTVVSRTREKFWELFRQRFEEAYPEGLLLQAAKQPTVMKYRPASQALIQLSYQRKTSAEFEIRIPNVLGFRRQFKNLPQIWNSCVDDLSGYSRAIGTKRQGVGAAVAAWSALPQALRADEAHPLTEPIQSLLSGAPKEGGFIMVPTGAIAVLVDIPERERLTLGQSEKLAGILKDMGWYMAPMPEFTKVPLFWAQEIALFSNDAAGEPGPLVPGIVRLLYLAVLLAAADGIIEDEEIRAFHAYIGNELESDHDAVHLRATEAVLRRDSNLALRALPQITSQIAQQNRPAVFQALVHMAAADGEIGLDEQKVLRRVARAFELDEDALDVILREEHPFGEVVVAGRGEETSDKGEAIPPRTAPEVPKGFKLDMDKVLALKQETHEVISMLSVVMDEPESESVGAPGSETSTAIAVPQLAQAPAGWLHGLENRYHGAVLHLIRLDEITWHDFEALASRHHLLPDDLLQAVNTWSDEAFGDFLLDHSSNVRIFTALLPPEAASNAEPELRAA